MFRHLSFEHVSTNLVASCAASFKAKNAEDIKLLKDLVETASKKTPEVLELEEINDMANDLNKQETSGNRGSAEEKKMYDPLVRNTQRMSSFSVTHTYHRCTCLTS